jgi:hypothetical protein
MDRRQEQLIAAAEAVRMWVHAQRATWSAGYPRAFPDSGPQFATVGVLARAASPSVIVEGVARPSPSVGERAGVALQWLRAWSGHVATPISRVAAVLRQSWRVATVVGVVLLAAWTVRTYWSGMTATVTADLAAGRRAVNTQRQALTERANAEVAKVTAARPTVPTTAKRRLQVESNPTSAHVLIDGRDRGLTPLTLDDLPVGSHKVVIRAPEGSVQRTISIAPTGTIQLNEAIFSGWLRVSSPIDLQISEARRAISLDDSNQVLIAPGPHEIRLENRALGLHEVRRIDVRPGETTSISLEPPPSHVSVTAADAATVAIDGEPVGQTPLVDYPVAIGTRDLTVTSASGEVRRRTITVTVQPVRIEVDFSKR